jgi:thiol-disulfide isomerase/thioredoxin
MDTHPRHRIIAGCGLAGQMSGDRSMTQHATGATSSRPSGLLRFAHGLADAAAVLPVEGHLPSFDGATGWLNSEPLTAEGLRGRVVLVDFWTYTCVNWLRTLPYRRAWVEKYGHQGLTLVGVHTPEFGFERDVDNIVAMARSFGVDYPIAIDSDYGVWRAFANHFWPAVYIADVEGRIRFRHFGEGEYAMTEMVIQQLLMDAGADGVGRDLVTVDPRGLEVPADWSVVQSPETYVGYDQSTGFASEDTAALGQPHVYSLAPLRLNQWAVSGTWTVTPHAGVLDEPGGRLAFRFHARDLNLVMGPASRGASVPFRVSLDGRPPNEAHGTDVAADGTGTVAEQRTYQLIRQPGPIADRVFEIEFLGAGLEAYCFTFG